MILKGSTISSVEHARKMSDHLFKDENEQILIRQGLSSEATRRSFENDLVRMQLLTRMTKGEHGIFHVAMSPRKGEILTPEQHEAALKKIEAEFDLTGQSRVQIDHIKDGKLHTHVLWSRVDQENKKLIPLSKYGKRLKGLAAEVARDNGYEPAPQDVSEKTFRTTHAERMNAKRTGRHVMRNKEEVTAIWYETETGKEFINKLRTNGYDIAEGNGCRFALIDPNGKVSNLVRQLPKGIQLPQVLDRVGELERNLKDVETTRKLWAERNEKALETKSENKAVKPKTREDGSTAKKLYIGLSVDEAARRGLDHFLERKSTVSESRLTFHVSQNSGLKRDAIREVLKRDSGVIRAQRDGVTFLTTYEAVGQEEKLIEQTNEGQGRHFALNTDYEPKQEFLNEGQRGAIRHVLTSNDGVILISGGAGVGKTSLLKEVKEGIEERGGQLHAFAPSAEASRDVLQGKGFEGADTIASLLRSKKKQEQTRSGVILIDEAGMVGNKTMNRILEIAKEQDARVILSGDYRQHNSPEAGDALRIIEAQSGLKAARISEIVRQKNEPYKQAVDDLAAGRIRQGFDRLNTMGAITEEVDDPTRYKMAAKAYSQSLERGRSALIVSPTHAEGQEVAGTIRQDLKVRGIIKGQDRRFDTQMRLSMTQDQMRSAASYGRGMVVEFHGQVDGFEMGKAYTITGRAKTGGVILRTGEGDYKTLPLNETAKFQVFQKTQTEIAKGDLIRITANGKSMEEEAINNGQTDTVAGFDKDGNIRLASGQTVSKDYRNFALGYYATSHASQGRDAQDVYIVQGSRSFLASSQKQFYVSVSRGVENIQIFTDDKEGLAKAIVKSGDRMTAKEIAKKSPTFVFNQNQDIMENNQNEKSSEFNAKAKSGNEKQINQTEEVKKSDANKNKELAAKVRQANRHKEAGKYRKQFGAHRSVTRKEFNQEAKDTNEKWGEVKGSGQKGSIADKVKRNKANRNRNYTVGKQSDLHKEFNKEHTEPKNKEGQKTTPKPKKDKSKDKGMEPEI